MLTSLILLLAPADDLTPTDDLTWSGRIAAVVHEKCSGCHREGQSGPFELLTYEQAVEHSGTIEAVVEEDYMPPWPPSLGTPPLRHDRRLTTNERNDLLEWVRLGTPAGDLSKAPEPPRWPSVWRLGDPDHVVSMDQAFEVPADGRDIYRWFALPLGFDEDKYLKAIEYRPTARGSVHHVLFFKDLDGVGMRRERADRDRQPGFRGMRTSPDGLLGGYVPGSVPAKWPEGIAVELPAGSDLVLQTHFHPSGRTEREQGSVALYFADKKPERPLHSIQLPPAFGQGAGIDVPPGETDWTLVDEFTLPCDVTAVGVSGHAHYICAQMDFVAEFPDGRKQTLLAIDDWDLDWQGDYLFERAVSLPAGTKLTTTLIYDNSADNPDNPFSPPRRIKWGRESTDEMGSMTLSVITGGATDDRVLHGAVRRHRFLRVLPKGELKKRLAKIGAPSLTELAWFNTVDKSGDGKLQTSEIPEQWHRLHGLLDVNSDGGVTPEEFKVLRTYSRE